LEYGEYVTSSVLITGAGGALGRATAARLAKVCEVSGVVRAPPATPVLGLSRTFVADVRSADWGSLLEEVEAVIHLAAFVHRPDAAPLQQGELIATNRDATAALAAACRSAGKKLVFASSISVYGPTAAALRESTPLEPETVYGRSKLEAEEAIRRECARGLRAAILRLPLLYGPFGRGNMERMLGAISRGRYWPIGDPAVPKSCLHFDDAAAALELALSDRVEGTFNVAPEHAPTLGEIHAAAYAAVGRRAPPHAPAALASLAATLADGGLRLIGRRPRLSRAIETLVRPALVDGQRFAVAAGFAPVVPLVEGLRGTAQALVAGGRG
jgi:nucleoside-diphosphate-sugar epimerase